MLYNASSEFDKFCMGPLTLLRATKMTGPSRRVC